MSEPKRYNAWGKEVPDGDYVRYDDVKHIISMRNNLFQTMPDGTIKPVFNDEAVARLKAEVERLEDFNAGLLAMQWKDEKGNLLTAADYNRMRAEIKRIENVEFALGVIRDILGDHLGRHYYYKIDYAMKGDNLKTYE